MGARLTGAPDEDNQLRERFYYRQVWPGACGREARRIACVLMSAPSPLLVGVRARAARALTGPQRELGEAHPDAVR